MPPDSHKLAEAGTDSIRETSGQSARHLSLAEHRSGVAADATRRSVNRLLAGARQFSLSPVPASVVIAIDLRKHE